MVEKPPKYTQAMKGGAIGFAVLLLAVILQMSVAEPFVHQSSAEELLLQSASGQVRGRQKVSASFFAPPRPGDLIVAVIGTRDAVTLTPSADWRVALNETDQRPGLAVLYRFANKNDSETYEVTGFSRRTNIALQLYAYEDMYLLEPMEAAASASDESARVEWSEVDVHPYGDVMLRVAAFDRPTHVIQVRGDVYEKREWNRTFGSGPVALDTSDRYLEKGGTVSSRARIGRRAQWTSGIVVFNRRPDWAASYASPSRLPVDLSLDSEVVQSSEVPEEWTYTVRATNSTAIDAHDVYVHAPVPSRVRFDGVTLVEGLYQPAVGLWRIPKIEAGATEELVINIRPGESDGATILSADLIRLAERDWVSDNNHAMTAMDPIGSLQDDDCDAVGTQTVVINDGESEVVGETIPVFASATNATYAMVAEEPSFLRAQAIPVDVATDISLSDGVGTKTLYIWLGNACGVSRVEEMLIERIEPPPVEESEQEEETPSDP